MTRFDTPEAFHEAWLNLAVFHVKQNTEEGPRESGQKLDAETIEQQARWNAARIEAIKVAEYSLRDLAHLVLSGIPPIGSSMEWCREQWELNAEDYQGDPEGLDAALTDLLDEVDD